ncbi:DUF1097 family protein [Konateibacter massiliensis]|uniref:DUF1097 family protein n=1 Tax=Konateibacter massiliensis TaxID=2002841 RepID=UPI000C15305F|nr:DUF1097 family protein [Konateibacter massiliensis]
MKDKTKIGLVQALVGAIILTLLMQIFGIAGFGQYMWMLFFPILLFFALGAKFTIIPSMIVCYICGVLWAYLNGIVQGIFASFSSEIVVNIVPTIIIIFLVLTIHRNLLENTLFGNIPALFLGMCTTFFVFMMEVDLTPLHLVAFFLYGIFLAASLVVSGMVACSIVFGKERTMAVFTKTEATPSK